MAARTTLYEWFSRLKKPTALQFKALIDTFWSKEEDSIGITDISGLTDVLNSKVDTTTIQALVALLPIVLSAATYTYNVPAGADITKVKITDPGTVYFSIGTSSGASDISTPYQIVQGDYVVVNKHFVAATTIFFNGLTANSIVTIYP